MLFVGLLPKNDGKVLDAKPRTCGRGKDRKKVNDPEYERNFFLPVLRRGLYQIMAKGLLHVLPQSEVHRVHDARHREKVRGEEARCEL